MAFLHSYKQFNNRFVRVSISTLLEAIKYNSLDAVKHFLKNTEEDINKLDSDGYTPLARAVARKNMAIVKYLVSEKADVCKVGRNGKTPLCLAVEQQKLEMISFLLENGAKHTVQSAFLTAIETENIEIVTILHKQGALVDYTYHDGYTPLIKAVEIQDPTVTKYLIDNSADVQTNVQSAFLTAIQTKNVEIISMLHEKGALVNFTYKDGHTPLTKAIDSQDPTVTKYLIDNGADVQTVVNEETNCYLLKLVKSKSSNMVKVLCEAGCNLDKPGECGYTPLTKATELEDFETVQCLIEHGATVNCIDGNKKTALAIATSNCSFRISQYLIDSGADIQLAQPEVDDYRSWNDDFARYLALLKIKPKSEETGHEEDIQ